MQAHDVGEFFVALRSGGDGKVCFDKGKERREIFLNFGVKVYP